MRTRPSLRAKISAREQNKKIKTWVSPNRAYVYKEEKGKKQSRKRSVKSRVALLTSGTFNLQLERWCREFDSQIARPTEHHPQIVQRSLLHSASAGFSFF